MCSQDARCGIGIEPIEHEMVVNRVGDDLQGGQAQPHYRRLHQKHVEVFGARSST